MPDTNDFQMTNPTVEVLLKRNKNSRNAGFDLQIKAFLKLLGMYGNVKIFLNILKLTTLCLTH